MSGVELRSVKSAAALIIGAELLSGKVRDENAYSLGLTLRALGIELRRVVFCPDEREVIARDVLELSRSFDVVITSGGVGPTHDDVTMQGVADAFDVEIEQSQDLSRIISAAYGERTNETHLLMARVPSGARLAEATDIRWPTVVKENVWILPGVPELFRMKLGVLRQHLRGPDPFFSESIYCSLEETELKESLDLAVSRFEEVEFGSYPKWFDERYKTRLTVDSRSQEQTQQAADFLRDLLQRHVIPTEEIESS